MFEIGKYGSDYISKFAKPVELADNFTQNSGNFITHGNQTGDLNSFWQIAGTSKNRGIATGRFQSGASNSFTSANNANWIICLLYTSPSPRDGLLSRMPSSA